MIIYAKVENRKTIRAGHSNPFSPPVHCPQMSLLPITLQTMTLCGLGRAPYNGPRSKKNRKELLFYSIYKVLKFLDRSRNSRKSIFQHFTFRIIISQCIFVPLIGHHTLVFGSDTLVTCPEVFFGV